MHAAAGVDAGEGDGERPPAVGADPAGGGGPARRGGPRGRPATPCTPPQESMPGKATVNVPRPLARTRRVMPARPVAVIVTRTRSRARKPLPWTRNGLLPDGTSRAWRVAAGDPADA